MSKEPGALHSDFFSTFSSEVGWCRLTTGCQAAAAIERTTGDPPRGDPAGTADRLDDRVRPSGSAAYWAARRLAPTYFGSSGG